MANQHRRASSIPTVRLSQPLPPLPLEELQPRDAPQITIIPYHDDPSADELPPKSPEGDNLPPSYEPMYDYLRSQHLLPPPPLSIRISSAPEIEEPYRDEPFVITIDHDFSQTPPPSYEDLYIEEQNQRELLSLVNEFDVNGNPVEEICKFTVAMLLIALTVGLVGTAFHWGMLGCNGQNC